MTALPPDVVADLSRLVAELEQRLESSFAAHDAAIAQQAAAAEENARLRAELGIARDRQNASAEILRTIAAMSGDAERSLYQIAETSAHLFGATSATIQIAEGDGWAQTIRVGDTSKRVGAEVPIALLKIGGRNMPGTIVAENRQIHVPDLDNVDPSIADWPGLAPSRAAGTRTMCGSPLRREGKAIGVLIVYRDRLLPFTDEELALQQSFADQAAIAIENARLFNETKETLERQTATADILKVIAGSPSDVQPVFDAIVGSAAKLFQPCAATITTLKDGKLHWNAVAELVPSFDHKAAEASYPIPFDPDRAPSARAVLERRIIEIPDTEAPDTPEITRKIAANGGFRSITFVPLVLEDKGIGTIILTHPTTGFKHSDKQLALIQTFADQAVIAIENARLFNETRAALERQTATAEILKVIAASPSDAQPVFEAIADSAKRLLGGFSATVLRFLGDELHLVAYTPTDPAADEGLTASFPRSIADFPTFALVRNGETVQFPDSEAEHVPQLNRELARLRGFRSVLFTPLMNRGAPVGMISVTRAEPGAFAADHVQLLQTFADQAVIAIENARLFNETRQALERQTATAEVLKVMAGSPSDVQPVFEAVVASANRLIGGFSTAMFRFVDDHIDLSAFTPTDPAGDAVLQSSFPMPSAEFPPYHLVRNGAPAELVDTELEPAARDIARARGYRSMLFAPLMNEGKAVGIITVTRRAPGSFGEPHVRLLQMFAAQSVIAIENVRLFNETREALERQTATAEILRVIASSPSDTRPVFEAIATSANRLLGGFATAVFRLFDGAVHLAAFTPVSPAADAALRADFPRPVDDYEPFRLAQHGKPFPIPDTEEISHAPIREIARLHGFRSMLHVPLMNGGVPIGIISVTRRETGAFSPNHVQLLQTFADQAVIAIQNARLFNEVKQRTEDLSESLQQQTATADVLKVISRSAFDLQTVLNTLVESAARLCEADMAAITRRIGEAYYRAGSYGFPEQFTEYIRGLPVTPDRRTITGRTLLEGNIVHINDVLADPDYDFEGQQLSGNPRSFLGVPLLREGTPVGALTLTRLAVKPFTEKQIELIATFADQAVIAIENVRLFDEVQAKTRDLTEALEYQTAIGEVLNVISRSPNNLQPVMETIVHTTRRLCQSEYALMLHREGDGVYRIAAHSNASKELMDWMQDNPVVAGDGSAVGIVAAEKQTVHLPDALADPRFTDLRRQRHSRARTMLGVPLLRGQEVIGVVFLARTEVKPFSDKQIDLVTNFADQAVIAIENVRLFDEVQSRTRDLTEALTYQTGSGNILRVIASSPTDVKPVLTAIVESACELCEADDALATLRDGDELVFQAQHGSIPVVWKRQPIDRKGAAGLAVINRAPVHVHDLLAPEGEQFPRAREFARTTNVRTVLCVPLLREGESIGAIVLRRTEVRPFSDKQISLLQTFADQAVIAIGNVRLFEEVQQRTRELSESLEQQTATSEVLQVISSSPGELEPVFKSMMTNALRICHARFGNLLLFNGEGFILAELHNAPAAYGELFKNGPLHPGPHTGLGRLIATKQVVHIADVQAASDAQGDPLRVATIQILQARSFLAVPMLKERELVGAIVIYRQEVWPFSSKEIELVSSFASQAVIAIENARLLKELRERTDDLTRSLDDLRTAQDRLVQTEKLASLGQLTAGIAHEIKNPLNFVNNFAALSAELTDELNDLLKPAALSDQIREEVGELTGLLKDNLQKVVQHGKRADSIVKNMLLHSREGSGDHRPTDINALLDESLNLAYHGARAEKPNFNVTLRRDFDPDAGMLEVFPQEITRVFLNLVSNGFYAVAKRKNENSDSGFDPALSATTRNLGDSVEIRIRDNGTGIPPEVKDKMFNPFFTTKPAGEGTGLGLSMSHDIIVKQHGGTIDVETAPGEFTEFRIVLPRTSALPNKNRGQT